MKITVYTLPSCGQCDSTKKYLTRKGAAFDTVDLSTDAQAFAAVQALGYKSAPVVIVNDDGDTGNEKHWYGFRPDMLAQFCLEQEADAA